MADPKDDDHLAPLPGLADLPVDQMWPTQEPPLDFAERVMQRVTAERRAASAPGEAAVTTPALGLPGRGRATWRVAAVAASLLVCAASGAIGYRLAGPAGAGGAPAPGTRISADADGRREVTLGRAVAVLEAGAELVVEPGGLRQERGDVFYRVSPGPTPFEVRTAAGPVQVRGTCFRVKMKEPKEPSMQKRDVVIGTAGAVLGALVFVGVYEGRVRLGHAAQPVDLRAGQAASSDGRGWKRSDAALAEAEGRFDRQPGGASSPGQLQARIRDLREKLGALEEQRTELEQKLAQRETAAAPAAAPADAGAETTKGRYANAELDPTPAAWAELAKSGTVKYRTPCFQSSDWKPAPAKLEKLGLAPDDSQAITDAYARSNQRLWERLRPLCARAVGSAEVADKLGPATCVHTVIDAARKEGGEATAEAMRQVGEVRAGSRSAPAAGEVAHPVLEAFLALTAEMKSFEGDLAQTFGPDEARRITASDELCYSRNIFGGPGPRPATP